MKTFMRPAAAGILTLALLAACNTKDQRAAGSLDTIEALRTPDTAIVAAPVPTIGRWSSPNVLGFVVVANSGEVALGRLAQRKAMHADVKAFGNLMVTDHSAMLIQINTLGSGMRVVADTATEASRDLLSNDRDELIDMNEEPASAAWDREYMDEMIERHQDVLEKLRDAVKDTPDAQLKTAIEGAIGRIQTHLTKAESIRAKLK